MAPTKQFLVLMCGLVAMAVIDLAVANTALPSIQTDLDADPADLQWFVIGSGVFVAGFRCSAVAWATWRASSSRPATLRKRAVALHLRVTT